MSGLPDIEEIRSVSKFGLSAVTVVFHDSVDTYFARQLVLERLSQAREQIPENIGSPEMGPISTGLGEIYQYELKAAKGSGYDATALRTIQDWSVRRQLLGVPGVTEVNSFGGYEKQYQVRLEPSKLQSYGLSLRNVVEAVTQNNANVGGAYIEHGSEQYLLRGIGLVESPEDIGNIIVKTGKEGVPVYIRDLGEIVTGATVRQGAVTADGEGEIVAGIAMMLKGENSRAVVDRVKDRVEQVKKTLPDGVQLIPFYDRLKQSRTFWYQRPMEHRFHSHNLQISNLLKAQLKSHGKTRAAALELNSTCVAAKSAASSRKHKPRSSSK
jgi:cobalt-zinc-cadmium resistance protein CzcA